MSTVSNRTTGVPFAYEDPGAVNRFPVVAAVNPYWAAPPFGPMPWKFPPVSASHTPTQATTPPAGTLNADATDVVEIAPPAAVPHVGTTRAYYPR